MSVFAQVDQVPGDPILGLTEAYNADARPDKVNLGVGIYYGEDGRIPLLRAVQRLIADPAAELLLAGEAGAGDELFCDAEGGDIVLRRG